MKIKDGYFLRDICGQFIVVPVAAAATEHKGLFALNSTGAFLWEKLIAGADRASLISALCEEYEVEEHTACEDTDSFLELLGKYNILS